MHRTALLHLFFTHSLNFLLQNEGEGSYKTYKPIDHTPGSPLCASCCCCLFPVFGAPTAKPVSIYKFLCGCCLSAICGSEDSCEALKYPAENASCFATFVSLFPFTFMRKPFLGLCPTGPGLTCYDYYCCGITLGYGGLYGLAASRQDGVCCGRELGTWASWAMRCACCCCSVCAYGMEAVVGEPDSTSTLYASCCCCLFPLAGKPAQKPVTIYQAQYQFLDKFCIYFFPNNIQEKEEYYCCCFSCYRPVCEHAVGCYNASCGLACESFRQCMKPLPFPAPKATFYATCCYSTLLCNGCMLPKEQGKTTDAGNPIPYSNSRCSHQSFYDNWHPSQDDDPTTCYSFYFSWLPFYNRSAPPKVPPSLPLLDAVK